MSLQQLFQNLDDLIRTPEDIALLNAKVLGLAVQGKLVDQSSEDESTEELAARIWQKRLAMISAGEVDRQRDLDGVAESEYPFLLPCGWRFVRLGTLVSKMGAGSTPLGGKAVYVNEGIKFIRSQNVWNDGLRLDDVAFIPPAVNERMANTVVQACDVLLNITGASIGRSAVVPDNFDCANVSQHVAILRFIEPQVRQFMHLCIISPLVQDMISSAEVGISREGLSLSRLQHFVFPLPPLAEQHCIVAKVDELLAQTRVLEANLRRAQEEIVVVNQAALHRLATAEDPGSLHAAWHTISGAFDLLYNDPRPLAALRQTILQLAVSGSLARAEDGPTTDNLPTEWRRVRLGSIVREIQTGPFGSMLHRSDYVENGIPVVNPANIQDDYIVPIASMAVSESTRERLGRHILETGDIVLGRRGEMGRCAVVTAREAGWLCGSGSFVLKLGPHVNPEYLACVIRSPQARRYLSKGSVGSTMNNLNHRILSSLEVLLPPLHEQRYVVAKVDELLGMCDALERQLNRSAAVQKAAVASVLAHLSQET